MQGYRAPRADRVLGIGIDGGDASAQFQTAAAATRAACSALRSIRSPAEELALLRMCTSVCRVQHMLRAVGPFLPPADLLEFDEAQDAALSAILGGDICGLSLDRASCGAQQGGLGLRHAAELRFAAFLASRIDARPLAEELLAGLPEDLQDRVFAQWDREVDDATAAWMLELPGDVAPLARQLMQDGEREAAARTARILGHT